MKRRFAVATLLAVLMSPLAGGTAAGNPPVIDAPVIAVFHGGTLTLEGSGFGTPSPDNRLTFDDGETTTQLDSTSLFVASWTDGAITAGLPLSVRTGTVRVAAGGAISDARDLYVFDISYQGVPLSGTLKSRPLDVAVAPGGWLWTDDEFHTELKSYSADPLEPPSGVMPPQAPGPGIFAQQTIGNTRTTMSVLGEDVDVDSQGRVWFTQGGGYLYEGPYTNVSRILRFDPASETFACFNAPTNRAEVIGLAVDEARGLVWFAESGLVNGNAITAFDADEMPSNCLFDPDSDPWPAVCPGDVAPGCYRRYPLPQPERGPAHIELDAVGDVWFTQSWATSIGRLSPATGAIDEFPLPAAEAAAGPGALIGSFPWQLAFDANGDLWLNEQFDAEIYRFRPSLIDQLGCTALDASGDNPCAEEVFDGSNNTDGKIVHSLTIAENGNVWFTLSRSGEAQAGFISPAHGGAVALLPPLASSGILAGIGEDPVSGAIWFAMFDDRRIGRLDPATSGGPDSDGDGCADAEESGDEPMLGGMRDPVTAWDFYDVAANRVVDAADIGAVRSRFSPMGTPPGEAAFDRSPGPYGWAPGPPDGRINAIDVGLVRSAYNHSCQALP